jgi:4-alpha-glucanotransferase
MKEKPLAERYARFRANMEAREASWPRWPGRQRNGRIRRGDHDEELFRYHLYVQWRTHQQFEATGRSARDTGPGLYLDFPLGTHREGFDVWLAPHLFAPDAEAGAPPDSFFSLGQRWGTPPMRPAALREDRYRLFRHALRHHMRNAGYLRVDHVMGLHRLYWVPEGLEPHEGVYVRYPAEELLAVLSLESHINRTILIGEDLGTVPPVTRAAMKRHGMRRTWIFSAADEGAGELPTPPAGSFAALNTHDMPTFAALWKGRDLAERRDLGLLDAREAKRLGKARRATLRKLAARLHRKGWLTRPAEERAPVLEGCLRLLGASRAGLVMVNLEDLWGETEQQNTPGTVRERPNWRRRARLSLSEIDGLRTAARALAALAATRGGER